MADRRPGAALVPPLPRARAAVRAPERARPARRGHGAGPGPRGRAAAPARAASGRAFGGGAHLAHADAARPGGAPPRRIHPGLHRARGADVRAHRPVLAARSRPALAGAPGRDHGAPARLDGGRTGGRARARGLAPAGCVRDGDVRARSGERGRSHRPARSAPGPARVPSSAARAGGRRPRSSPPAACVGKWWSARAPGARPAIGGTWPGAARSGTWRWRRAASTGSSATACATNGSWRASWTERRRGTDARAYYRP